MSGECKKCSNHTTECSCSDDDRAFLKVHFDHLYPNFHGLALTAHVTIKDDGQIPVTKVFPPFNASDDGQVDITQLVDYFNVVKKDHPKASMSLKVDGFMPQLPSYSKDLLTTRLPSLLEKLFKREDSDEIE